MSTGCEHLIAAVALIAAKRFENFQCECLALFSCHSRGIMSYTSFLPNSLVKKTLLHQQELGKQRDLRLLVLSLCPDFLLSWVAGMIGSTVAVPVRFQ